MNVVERELDHQEQEREDDSDERHRAGADGDQHLDRTSRGDVEPDVDLRREEGQRNGGRDAQQLDGSGS